MVMTRSYIRVGVIVAIALVFLILLGAYKILEVVWHAQMNAHAFRMVLELTAEHARATGEWPNNWDDLKPICLDERQQNVFRWPDDYDEIRRRIIIDFSLDIIDVVRQDASSFTPVREIGPRGEPDEVAINALIRKLNTIVNPSKSPADSVEPP